MTSSFEPVCACVCVCVCICVHRLVPIRWSRKQHPLPQRLVMSGGILRMPFFLPIRMTFAFCGVASKVECGQYKKSVNHLRLLLCAELWQDTIFCTPFGLTHLLLFVLVSDGTQKSSGSKEAFPGRVHGETLWQADGRRKWIPADAAHTHGSRTI